MIVYSKKSGNVKADSKIKPMIIIKSKKKPLLPGTKDKNGKPILSLKEKYPDAMIESRGVFTNSFLDAELSLSHERKLPYFSDGRWLALETCVDIAHRLVLMDSIFSKRIQKN